jgi:hypothetical protein
MVLDVSALLTQLPNTCVILSSPHPVNGGPHVYDASCLTVRENAALTHFATLLIGCSSGITWLNTSDAAKGLPTLQLLNPFTPYRNIPAGDHARFGLPTDKIIQLFSFTTEKVYSCVELIIMQGFEAAKQRFNETAPESFATSSHIIYNRLCQLDFKGVLRHCKIMRSVYGSKAALNSVFARAIILFPVKLLGNLFVKRVLRRKLT